MISHFLYRSNQDYSSSIFSNIFAGLITGLIICLLSGVKQFYVAKLKNKKNWLEHIRGIVSDYIDLFHRLTEKQFATFDGEEELFRFHIPPEKQASEYPAQEKAHRVSSDGDTLCAYHKDPKKFAVRGYSLRDSLGREVEGLIGPQI